MDVNTVKCWISRQVSFGLKRIEKKIFTMVRKWSENTICILYTYFASSASAYTPAASGAAAEVPE